MADDSSIPTFLSLHSTRAKPRRARAASSGAQSSAHPGSGPSTSSTSPQLAFDLFAALPAPAQAQPPAAREPILYTVRQLISELRQHLEAAYTGLLSVEGEISNCRPAASGHLYFTLKDGDAQLPVVMFRRQAQLLPFKLKDGLAVEVRGRISVYESRGQLQLLAETLRPRGTGALQLAFEQLRDRLRAEGLFDRPRQALPSFPICIGIVTSPSGAAIRDIIQVIRRRHGRLNLLIYPAIMQGAQCPASVAAGIRWFNRHPDRAELILIARGGGSLEDLAGFNDERLARTIVASKLPIVSAIGHEIDHTIADFVADLRAPTPSAAAELITAAQHRIEDRVLALERRVRRAGDFHLLRARQRLQRLSASHVLARLRDSIGLRDQHLDDLRARLETATERTLRSRKSRLTALESRLRRSEPTLRLAQASRRLASASDCMQRAGQQIVHRRRQRLERASLRLQALSPLAVLNRGYAIVYTQQGTIMRDPTEASPNERIQARLAHGTIHARVTTSPDDLA